MNTSVRYLKRSYVETDRQRREREALSRSVERQHVHAQEFGPKRPVPVDARPDTSWHAFQTADYGVVCQVLGLRPSKPNAPASA